MGLFSSKVLQKSNRLHSLRVTDSIYGKPIPVVFGQNRVAATLLWYGNFQSHANKQKVGGKGIGAQTETTYNYTAAIIASLCQGPISGITQIWDSNGRLGQSAVSESYVVPPSATISVTQAAYFNLDLGVGQQAPYSVSPNDYGAWGQVPLQGTYTIALSPTTTSPGVGEYQVQNGQYVFNSNLVGQTVTINYTYSAEWLLTTENFVVPSSSPYQVTVQQEQSFHGDVSVIYYPAGNVLTRVSGSPSQGQYSVNNSNGTYTFSSADINQQVSITYQYQDSSSLQLPTTQINVTLFEGTLGQAPWGFMTSNFSGEAMSYSELAYIASQSLNLGQDAELPNYNYEVIGYSPWGAGINDAHPCNVILALLTNGAWGVGYPALYLDSWARNTSSAFNYWAANGFFISPVLENQQSAASYIQSWCDAGQVGVVFSEGLLKLIPYGDTTAVGNGYTFTPNTTPIVDLDDDDFVSFGDGENPVQMNRKDPRDLYNSVKVEWSPRTNNYNGDALPEYDDGHIAQYGSRPEAPQTYDFICTQQAAQFAAIMRLRRNTSVRKTGQIKIGWWYSYLEPMDIITLTDATAGLNLEPVRITQIEDDGQYLTIQWEEWPWGAASPTLYPKNGVGLGFTPTSSQAIPGPTSALIFEATNRMSLQQGDCIDILCSSPDPNWGGCDVWVSLDGGASYQPIARVDRPALAGYVQSPLLAVQNTTYQPYQLPGISKTLEVFIEDGYTSQQLASSTPFELHGWAIAGPNTIPDGQTAYLQLFVDGQYIGDPEYGLARPDVAYYYPNQANSPNLGWQAFLQPAQFSVGWHTVSVTAQDNVGNVATSYATFYVPDTMVVQMDSEEFDLTSNLSGNPDGNLAVILAPNGGVEIIKFQAATLEAPGRYALSGVMRGQLGTVPLAHAVGNTFSMIAPDSIQYQYDPAFVGQTLYFKCTSFNTMGNHEQSLSQVPAIPYTISGSARGAIAGESGIYLTGYGSVAPSFSTAITYTSDGSSITWNWNIPVYRTDQAASILTLQGSQQCTGLSPNTTYDQYPYVDNTVLGGLFTMVPDGGVGAPPWAHLGDNLACDQLQNLATRTPLSNGPLLASTVTAGNTGGGSGGGIGGSAQGESGQISLSNTVDTSSGSAVNVAVADWLVLNEVVGHTFTLYAICPQLFGTTAAVAQETLQATSGSVSIHNPSGYTIEWQLVDDTTNTILATANGAPTGAVVQGAPPSPPTNVAATASTTTSISVSWSVSSPGEVVVFMSTTSGFAPSSSNQAAVQTNPNLTSILITGLTPGTTYYFVAETFGNNQYSNPSGQVSATTLPQSSNPTGVTGTLTFNETTNIISWTTTNAGNDTIQLRATETYSDPPLQSTGQAVVDPNNFSEQVEATGTSGSYNVTSLLQSVESHPYYTPVQIDLYDATQGIVIAGPIQVGS